MLLENNHDSTPTSKHDSNRESVTPVALDTLVDEDMWNMDIDDILEVSEKVRKPPPSRSFSMVSQRMKAERSSCPESSSNRPNPRRVNRTVSFGKVEVRSFERILSPNPPSCSPGGPSLGLGWAYTEKKPVDVDRFENKGLFLWNGGKRSKDILLTAEKREKLAKKYGFSKEEIQANAMAVDKINKQRRRTVDSFLEAQYEAMFVQQKVRKAQQLGLS